MRPTGNAIATRRCRTPARSDDRVLGSARTEFDPGSLGGSATARRAMAARGARHVPRRRLGPRPDGPPAGPGGRGEKMAVRRGELEAGAVPDLRAGAVVGGAGGP